MHNHQEFDFVKDCTGRHSRLYEITTKEIPFKRATLKNIERTRELYRTFHTDTKSYNILLEKNKKRLVTLGIIASQSGEEDLALDILERAENKAHYKYLLWKKSGKSKDFFVGCLGQEEYSPIIGIMVNQGDFDTANKLRWNQRAQERQGGDYGEAAKLSYKMHDWQGLLDDIKQSKQDWGVFSEPDLSDLLKYARVASKQNREVSTQIYSEIEKMASEEKRWGLLGMVLSEKGEKQKAIKYYEKAKRFIPAVNLRKNLGLSTTATARKAMKQAFNQERLDSSKSYGMDDWEDGDWDGGESNENKSVGAFESPYPGELKKTRKLAKRFGFKPLLENMLRDRGFYFTLEYLGEELGENKQGHKELASKIRDTKEKMTSEKWNLFYQEEKDQSKIISAFGEELASMNTNVDNLKQRLTPQNLFSAIGFSRDVTDTLILEFLNKYSPKSREWEAFFYINNWNSRTILADFGLETIKSLFNSKRYSLLVEGTPTLLTEKEEDFEGRAREFNISVVNKEIEIQEQAMELIKTAGKRLRRKLTSLNLDFDSYYSTSFGERALERMGFRY